MKIKEEKPVNIPLILLILFAWNEDKSVDFKEEQPLKINMALVNSFLNLNLTFILFEFFILYLKLNSTFLLLIYKSIFSSNIFLLIFFTSK